MSNDINRDMRELVNVVDAEFGKGVFVPEKLDSPDYVVFAVADNGCPYFSIRVGDAPDQYSIQVELYGPAHEKPLAVIDGQRRAFPFDLVEDCQTDVTGVLGLLRKYRHADGNVPYGPAPGGE